MSAAQGRPSPRGEFVDIGGRKLRIVCDGPQGDGPIVVLEAGAFGLASDWAVVQSRLAAEGVRSCAYDRAGMGYSDPGPSPRDGIAVAEDLEKLLAAAHERPPYILVGHSMAGLRIWLFAKRNHQLVQGLVFVDATTPESSETSTERAFLAPFTLVSRAAAISATAGLMQPLRIMGDTIGLPPQAADEKRWAFGDGRHNRTGAAEGDEWMRATRQALDSGPLDPSLPVAVVTAGRHAASDQSLQAAPARQSRRGYFANAEHASHANLLGPLFADQIIKAIDFVRAAAADAAVRPDPGQS